MSPSTVNSGLAGLFLLAALASPTLAQQTPPAAAPAVAVGVVGAEKKAINQTADFVGRVVARERVEIKARIEGYLEAVLFKEGDVVKEGTPLYRIEKGTYEAAVQQAQGELERSKASLTLATVQRERAVEKARILDLRQHLVAIGEIKPRR